MSKSVVDIWNCDRCARSEHVGRNEQPSGWVSVRIAEPPNHAEPERRSDLCRRCARDLDRWLAEAPPMVVTAPEFATSLPGDPS